MSWRIYENYFNGMKIDSTKCTYREPKVHCRHISKEDMWCTEKNCPMKIHMIDIQTNRVKY